MAQQPVRKRGANYTQEEKSLLLDLVLQFKHIIECKKTGGLFVQKKREAWNAITVKYNSNCSSGKRDTEQLKSLYDNMKQKSRKDVGESNKIAYINAEQNRMVTEDDLAHALKVVKDDKIEMNKTGGGFWKPKMNDNDAKVLAIIQDQVEPLYNPYDSASSFFKEAITCPDPVNIILDYASTSSPPTQEMTEKAEDGLDSEVRINIKDVHAEPVPKVLGTYLTPTRGKSMKKKKATKEKKLVKNMSADALKRLYFKKKCQNADLERKKLMMEILQQKKEHNLRIELLKNKARDVNIA